MRNLLPVVFTSLLASGLTAQQPTLETGTDVGVFAKTGNAVDLKFTKKGTSIPTPLTLSAVAGTAAKAQVTAQINSTTLGSTTTVAENGAAVLQAAGSAMAGSTASTDPKNIQPGPHSFLMKIPARSGVKFKVVVSYSGRVSSAKASGAVDIGNDGSVEFSAVADSQVHRKEFSVTAPTGGLSIKLTTNAVAALTAAGSSAYSGRLSVDVTADQGGGARCQFTPYGTSCGPQLTAREVTTQNGTVVIFTTSGGQARGFGLFLIGARKLNVQIPFTRCFLLVLPIIALPHQLDRAGGGVVNIPVPKDFAGNTENQDAIVFQGGGRIGIQSTNGITLACKKGQ